MAKSISQSDTRWVKKPGKKGYVEQISTGKKVTGNIKLVADTTKGKAGQTQRYVKGVGKNVLAEAKGGGVRPGKPKAAPAAALNRPKSNVAGRTAPAAAAAKPSKPVKASSPEVSAKKAAARPSLSASERKGLQATVKRTGSYQAGSSMGSRRTTSPTVSAAATAGRKAGPTDKRTPAERAYDAGRKALGDLQRKPFVSAADIAREKKKRAVQRKALERYMAAQKKK